MKRLFVPLAVAIAFAALLAPSGQRASACVIDPNAPRDPTARAEVVVMGRISGWEVSREWIGRLPGPFADFIPIQLTMNVDRTFKGDAGSQVKFIDLLSLQGPNYSGESAGRGWGYITDCGPAGFQFDPTNYYAILGLSRLPLPDSTLSNDIHIYARFFVGSDPKGPSYETALRLLDKPDFPWMPVVAASILGPLAFLVVSSFFWRRPKAA
jgi:hypothetical protein